MSDTSSPWEDDAGLGSAKPDEWGSAVVSGDAIKLAKLILDWSGSKPARALSIVRDCVSLLEEEVEFSCPDSQVVPSALTTTVCPDPAGCCLVQASYQIPYSCLNALIVALDETCDGKSWYTSTKELQLVSLEFCMACRSYQTAHLKVDTEIPRRLLAAADAPPPHPKRLFRTRVPRLRARRVTWNMRTAAQCRKPIFAMTDIDCLVFGRAFEGSYDAVAWPRRLKTIEFHWDSRFNQPIDLVQWPASLQRLEFGPCFNQPVEGAKFPVSLQELLFCGDSKLNQPIEEVLLPSSVRDLFGLGRMGGSFNQRIEGVAWPPSLEHLEFGESFNQPIERVKFPASLKYFMFDSYSVFDQPIGQVAWPTSLQELTFGNTFNQPVEGTVWPDSLEKLVFGEKFNQPVDNVRWPASLQEVAFGSYDEVFNKNAMVMFSEFNQSIGSSGWPASLKRLTLGQKFRQSLQGPTSKRYVFLTGVVIHKTIAFSAESNGRKVFMS